MLTRRAAASPARHPDFVPPTPAPVGDRSRGTGSRSRGSLPRYRRIRRRRAGQRQECARHFLCMRGFYEVAHLGSPSGTHALPSNPCIPTGTSIIPHDASLRAPKDARKRDGTPGLPAAGSRGDRPVACRGMGSAGRAAARRCGCDMLGLPPRAHTPKDKGRSNQGPFALRARRGVPRGVRPGAGLTRPRSCAPRPGSATPAPRPGWPGCRRPAWRPVPRGGPPRR